jgi:hypothetical protein
MTAIAVRTQARNVRSLAAWSLYRSIMAALSGLAALMPTRRVGLNFRAPLRSAPIDAI